MFPVVDRFAYFCPFPSWTQKFMYDVKDRLKKKTVPGDCPLGHTLTAMKGWSMSCKSKGKFRYVPLDSAQNRR